MESNNTNNKNNIVVKSTRITVIDALRGFALLGVVIIHMAQHYGIFSFSMMEGPREPLFPAFDQVVNWIVRNVVTNKFINIFAFLFGMSFFIQMDRAKQKGQDFRKRFLWRMLILLVIGLIGNSFYTAEILPLYAFFGVILVFLYPLKNSVLILIMVLLLLGTPRIAYTAYDKVTHVEQVETAVQEAPTEFPAMGENFEMPEHMRNPSYWNSAKNNLTDGFIWKLHLQFGMIGRGYITLALFILGLVVGRIRFFENVHLLKKRNYMLLGGFALAYLVIEIALANLPPLTFMYMIPEGMEITPLLLTVMTLEDLSAVALSGVYVMAFIICYHLNGIRKYLDAIAPYGRMGLTNYETQGILGCLIFSMWGFGSIFGGWGATEVFFLGLVVYVLQAWISKCWLKVFNYGPYEWFWRCATYMKIQPLKKS